MASIDSKEDGDWHTKNTWKGGAVPKTGDQVTIKAVDTVTVEDSTTAKAGSIDVKGTLDLDGGTIKAASGLTVAGDLTGFGKISAATAVNGKGTITASGGLLDIKGTVDGSSPKPTAFHIDDGSTLEFDGVVGKGGAGGAGNPTITFEGAAGTLDLRHEGKYASSFHGTVAGFTPGDKMEIRGSAGDTVSFDEAKDQLNIVNKNGGIEQTIQLSGNFSGEGFSVSTSGGVDTITTNAICFMAGTSIRTPNGEVAVESLKRGDFVITADNLAKPVTWLGRQTVSTIFADPLRVWPVRIKAGAIDENVPARDLIVSPGHAILVDGALIIAGALVNGISIVRETVVPTQFTYYHIELEDHSLVMAENTPAETFVDNVDRLAFDNWNEHEALYPNGRNIIELPYSVAKSRRQIPVATRVKLAERAHAIQSERGSASAA